MKYLPFWMSSVLTAKQRRKNSRLKEVIETNYTGHQYSYPNVAPTKVTPGSCTSLGTQHGSLTTLSARALIC